MAFRQGGGPASITLIGKLLGEARFLQVAKQDASSVVALKSTR